MCQCKWGHLVAKIGTNANDKFETMQVAFFLAGEISQVIESIPWVRCASGNVFFVGIPVVILSAALLALSLLCLALGSHWTAMLFGIAMLCPAFIIRGVKYMNSETLDLIIIAAEVVYLALINHCLTTY